MSSRRRPGHATLLALALLVSTLAACDTTDAGVGLVEAQTFAEGVAKTTTDGAFRVVLTTDNGLAVGDNTLYVRLGFHDAFNPEAPGRGIPAAEVWVDAWMPYANGAVEGRGTHVGDGVYAVELELAEPGVWQLDLGFAVGNSIDDAVSFAFIVGAGRE
jgi:hypothetical protein